jgi:gliding motility-associated-like protein
MLNALAVGVDTACMVVCNRTTGLCDTTTVYIRVIPSNLTDSIIATDDSATVQPGRPLILNLFGNDTIRSTVTFFDFIFRPSKGTADTLSRGLIRYNPNVGACGLDSFRYIVCTGRYCDTATVRITIPCTGDLVAFNAISPNDDGMNDRFIIQGLDNYPNNELCIFSRWGTQVLNTQNYQQDWRGQWQGKDLPDGTYFYLLRNLDDNTILLSGFLQIAR